MVRFTCRLHHKTTLARLAAGREGDEMVECPKCGSEFRTLAHMTWADEQMVCRPCAGLDPYADPSGGKPEPSDGSGSWAGFAPSWCHSD